MKLLVIAGAVLAFVGAFILLLSTTTYPSRSDVREVRDISSSADAQRGVPVWVGTITIVGGLVVTGAGMRGRRLG